MTRSHRAALSGAHYRKGGARPPPGAPGALDPKEIEELGLAAFFEKVGGRREGLSSEEVQGRLEQYGPNLLEEKRKPLWRRLLSYFWGPIPWMIEVAAVLSVVNRDWESFGVIFALLIINGLIGFWEEKAAADALAALKGQLALEARALRDGRWQQVDAPGLVPGDVIRLRLGDIVPADVKLFDGDFLSVDQSALTGESLPVDKRQGGVAFSGTIVKQGEMAGAVFSTGASTFFGRTAKLVETAGAVSHFQKAVMHIGNFLIVLAVTLSAILIGVEISRGLPLLTLIAYVLIVVVASIPVAMPAVLSVTMALGALALSKMKAIVSRLTSIEEMAGIDILCTDKTGTLTQNKLTLGDPEVFAARDAQDLVLAAALASKEEDRDAIDTAVVNGLADPGATSGYAQTGFVPFDPVHKRTEATLQGPGGERFRVTKGAPQVIIAMCGLSEEDGRRAQLTVERMAGKGFRTIGVARADVEGERWTLLGILPLYDPPRPDSKRTLAQAGEHGIDVKMVTGDNAAIAREIARELGLGANIQPAGELLEGAAVRGHLSSQVTEILEGADGFAEVFPEHKYAIVKGLQERGHLVAMTGDGVNDAPALKQADVGIAVSKATDAARAAASLILTAPGLSTIINAVEEARRIFERMMSYTIYRIAMTLDILFFVVLAMLFLDDYPLTAIMIILLALMDDIPIMTIAWDNTVLPPRPVRWRMDRVLAVSATMGGMAFVETFGLYLIVRDVFGVGLRQAQTMMFLQLVAGGHLMLFLTRTTRPFWKRPRPALPLFVAIVATQCLAVLFAGFGWLMPAISWPAIGLIWAYDLAWMLVMDVVKLGIYRLLESRARHQSRFLEAVNRPLHPSTGWIAHHHHRHEGAR